MSLWEQLLVIAAFGQVIVIGVGAIFAYLQIGGLRRQQEAQLIREIFATFNEPGFAGALDFVYNGLSKRLTEPAYVEQIAQGRATVETHRELIVLHFFNELGLLVHEKMVGERPIVFIVASPAMRAWEQLAPVIELMRRHFPHAYTPYESLVVRARAIDLSTINARFMAETPQLREQWESTARDLADASDRSASASSPRSR
ncbi:MAG: hypothetical protein WA629_02720 [Candidatus Aquilonibacter sp.]